MSITGKIKTLFADSAKTEALFPRTTTKAVYDDNGVSLDKLLENTATREREYMKIYIQMQLASFSARPFVVSDYEPMNTNVLWIDTNATTGGLKYHDGSTWVHVPVAYT